MKLKVNIDGYIDKYGGFSLAQLKSIVESNTDATELELFINSEGGDVVEGFAIHDYLTALDIPVSCTIEGLCASIATVIALAAKKDKRKMYSNAKIMVHNPYWTPSAPIGMEADELSSLAVQLKDVEAQLSNFYVNKLELPENEVNDMMKAETWLTSSKALEMGFVSAVINEKAVSNRKQLVIKAQIKIENMTREFTEEQKSWIEKKFNNLKSMFKITIKNQVVKLEDGNEVFVETEDGDFMGKRVFLMEDGNMTDTPAPDGEHVTEDGRTIVVAGGIVTEVKEAEDVEALKRELAEAKANAEALNAKVTELETAKAEVETNFENANREFLNFKNQILTGKIENEQDFPKGGEPAEKSVKAKAIEIINQNKKK